MWIAKLKAVAAVVLVASVLGVGGGVAGYRALAGEGDTPTYARPAATDRAAGLDARREVDLLRKKLAEAQKNIITLQKALEAAEARVRRTDATPKAWRTDSVAKTPAPKARFGGAGWTRFPERGSIVAAEIETAVRVKEAELKGARAKLAFAKARVERLAKLYKEGSVAIEIVEEAKLELATAQAQVQVHEAELRRLLLLQKRAHTPAPSVREAPPKMPGTSEERLRAVELKLRALQKEVEELRATLLPRPPRR
jgi:hypothetical protein